VSSSAEDPPVELVEYDHSWPSRFADEERLICQVLGPLAIGPIEHVGSTAIPGLAAKPIIDIMVAVGSLAESRPIVPLLEQIGYHHYPYRSDVMHWFCKPSRSFRTHHLHAVPLGSRLWCERLAFRDHLRGHPDVAAAYVALKRRLAGEHRFDREAYTEGKGPFVAGVLRALPDFSNFGQAPPDRRR
jgi:GrpB-like predicted nucleotidyltransferase (UPF0157 family)